MKQTQLIFTPENGEKIYRGVKTQTRRLDIKKYMRFKNGQRFWIREACWIWGSWRKDEAGRWHFVESDRSIVAFGCNAEGSTLTGKVGLGFVRRPSIFMPRWACRSVVELVEDPRVERVQEITEEDAVAEGCVSYGSFRELWQSINGNSSWDLNHEVVRLAFRKVDP